MKKKLIKYQGQFSLALLLAVVIVAFAHSTYKYNKMNNGAAITMGQIYQTTPDYYYYHYYVNGNKYEGSIVRNRYKNYNTGDYLAIQYAIVQPEVHIVHSYMGEHPVKSTDTLPVVEVDVFDFF